jgi:hypothetical protein
MSAAAVLDPQDENDSEVRREDQNNINQFARLNARIHTLRQKKESLQVRSVEVVEYIMLQFKKVTERDYLTWKVVV